ncbi:MAG TPA: 2-phospho-L-lactate transferase [Thermomicrobiales bacterium]
MIVALAGGVGGAKLAQGLAMALPPGELTAIVNTADDFDLYGLRICPDLDTVLYTLAGLANPVTGWGIAGDTQHALGAMARLGRDTWFVLGDQDLATHILRTERLRAGATLTEVTAEFAAALGVATRLLPMSNDPVATMVETPDGPLEFQEYFVRRRQQDEVRGIVFQGIEQARPNPQALEAIAAAEVIVICPSNPLVSVGPILALNGMREALRAATAPIVAVSPIIGGRAVKGPADRMLASLGHESSAAGVAALYGDLLDGYVLDQVDAEQAERIEARGPRVLVTRTLMGDAADRRRLAEEVLAFGRSLSRKGAGVA